MSKNDDLVRPELCKVPEGQTPLFRKGLTHPLLDALKAGEQSRDSGEPSPYHGHSLEHILHAVGWVERDLRLALAAAKAKLPAAARWRDLRADFEAWRTHG